MSVIKPADHHRINGITVIGPELFTTDAEGQPFCPIASIFPKYRAMVTGREIHAVQALIMVDFVNKGLLDQHPHDTAEAESEESVFQDAVALFIRDEVVLIRSDPNDMQHIFAADELLQLLLPKERIQFTGVHLTEVRRALRRRGESWRISPTPRSLREVKQYIQSSRVKVHTGAVYYQNAPTGERFLSYEEFMRMRPLLRKNPAEALDRLKEIVRLTHLVNNQGARELSFFLPAGRSLASDVLQDLLVQQERDTTLTDIDRIEQLFDGFAKEFAAAAGPELVADLPDYAAWRTTMFCRLYDINEQEVEEYSLGLSSEFHLNVRWLPGGRIEGNQLFFEADVEPRARNLLTHFWQTWQGLNSINVGRVESSQTDRPKTGEQREVYLVVLGLDNGKEDIRLVRMMKWGVLHHAKQGNPQALAIHETLRYRDYIFDRLQATRALGLPIPFFNEIRFDEEIRNMGRVPVFFFDRWYVPGMATDKIPANWYGQRDFVVRLAGLLGVSAAASLTLGRISSLTGQIYFDDGDEVIQFDAEGLPEKLILSETTGSFVDWLSPLSQMLPHCLWHLARHLEKAHQRGIADAELNAAVNAFADSLAHELRRMQNHLRESGEQLRSLFNERPLNPGGIRSRWQGVLNRLETTDTEELRLLIATSPHLAPFRDTGTAARD